MKYQSKKVYNNQDRKMNKQWDGKPKKMPYKTESKQIMNILLACKKLNHNLMVKPKATKKSNQWQMK